METTITYTSSVFAWEDLQLYSFNNPLPIITFGPSNFQIMPSTSALPPPTLLSHHSPTARPAPQV